MFGLSAIGVDKVYQPRLKFGFNKQKPPKVETLRVDELLSKDRTRRLAVDSSRIWNALSGPKGIGDDSAPRFLILSDTPSAKPGALAKFRRKVNRVMAGIARQYNSNQLPTNFREVLRPPFDYKREQSAIDGPHVMYPSRIIAESYPGKGKPFNILNRGSRSAKFALNDFGNNRVEKGVYSQHLDSVRFPLLALMYGGNENIDPNTGLLAFADGRQLVRDQKLQNVRVPELFIPKPNNSNDWARDYSYLKPVHRRKLPDYTVPLDNWIVEPDFNIVSPGSFGGDRLAVLFLNSHNPDHGLLFHSVPTEPAKSNNGSKQSVRRVTSFTLEHVEPKKVQLS